MAVEGGRWGMARVGVLAVIEEELDAVRAALGGQDELGTLGYYSPDDGRQVVIRRCADRSNTPATHATRDLIEDFRPEVLLLTGIGGGIGGRDAVQPGDVVVADFLHYADFRKLAGERDLLRYAPYDQPSVSFRNGHMEPTARAGAWSQRIAVAPPDAHEPRVIFGPVVAGEKVLGSPGHEAHQYVVEEWDNAVAVDMESWGFARAVHEARDSVDYNPRLAVIRGVSDIVATTPEQVADNNAQRAAWKGYAAAAAAAFAAAVVERFLTTPDPRFRRGD